MAVIDDGNIRNITNSIEKINDFTSCRNYITLEIEMQILSKQGHKIFHWHNLLQ